MGEPGPEDAIGGSSSGSGGGALIDAELVSQGRDLHLQGNAGSEKIPDGVE
jgi:hypothetical protein